MMDYFPQMRILDHEQRHCHCNRMMKNEASIYINKELQRVSKKAMKTLESKDIIYAFPEQGQGNKTQLVLKKPKTRSSVRKVFLPTSVAKMLVAWKMEQDAIIEASAA